jgi:hypothetical protein
VDRALDHDDTPIQDWRFIHSYIISDRYAKVLRRIKNIPLIGFYFKVQLFNQFSFVYDVIVNLIEGHEQTINLIKEQYGSDENCFDDRETLLKICRESKEMCDEAEKYMNDKIETPFPEICKAI